ncbi:MAG: hypothetical protein ABJ004_07925 [Cyclobacteriaceae bacterium]
MQSTITKISLFSLLIIGLISSSAAQTATSITDSFDEIMEEYKTWQEYKVVPVTRMEEFKRALADSVAKGQKEISDLKKIISSQRIEMDSAQASIASLSESLEVSQGFNDQILFLGIPFKKPVYNSIVWVVIFVLLGSLILCYTMFLRSNRITKQAIKEREQVKDQLENQRTQSREKEVKLKRELQTALNKLNERS